MSGSRGRGGLGGDGKGQGRRGAAAVLTVAGADPSGASGVYRDIATFEALGCTGVAAITALTAQNTSRFASAEPASARMISAQIGAVFEDFDVGAVKVGMVRGREAVRAVRSALRRGIGGRRGRGGRENIPVVVDPVVRSTTGGRLLDARSLGPYREGIVPLAAVATPNVYELGVLAGSRRLARAGESGAGAGAAWAAVEGDAKEAARKVIGMGAGSVIVTGVRGGGRGGRTVMDMVFEGAKREPYPAVAAGRGGMQKAAAAGRGRRRGSGCTHSAALAALLASGAGLAEAARGAAAIAHRSVTGARPRGAGLPVAAPAVAAAAGGAPSRSAPPPAAPPRASASGTAAAGRLDAAAASLAAIPGIGRHIPECQTNIAYAPGPAPSSPGDVLGLDGRIVSTMSGGALVPGRAARGASRHVASALVEASRRFPSLRAAANIRYDPRTVDAARSLGMAVSSYDRAAEPAAAKRSEGSSVRWGVRSALRGARRARDAVYHTGDHGKEPMIVVFGTGPRDVVSKVARIAAEAGRRGRPTEIK